MHTLLGRAVREGIRADMAGGLFLQTQRPARIPIQLKELKRIAEARDTGYLIDMISISLAALRSSIFLVSACETLSNSSSPRFFSSSLIFLSFSSFSMASFKSRRTLRTAVR